MLCRGLFELKENDHFIKEEIKYNHTIFHPQSKFKALWSLVLALLLLYTAYVTPVQIAFFDNKTDAWTYIDYIVNGLFILDIFVTMNSSYFNGNNQLIQSRKKIILRYSLFSTCFF